MAEQKTNESKNGNAGGDTGYVGWGDVGGKKSYNGGGKGETNYPEHVRLQEGTPSRLRLVDKPFKFWRHYDPIMAISPGYADDVCWQAGHQPRERYAIRVLDRSDGNKLKILEGGPSIFNDFKGYFELTSGKDPGGQNGPDWLIKVEIPMGKNGRKDRRMTKYHVMRDEKAPFTKEELASIKANWFELPEMKKPHTAELIAEMFEAAKVRGNDDPIPGSSDWWKIRRALREASNGDKDDSPSDEDSPLIANADDESDESLEIGDGGFGSLFDLDDSDDDSTGF